MKKGIKQLNTVIISVALCLAFSLAAFAEDGVRYSNQPTVTPIRIFFAILVVVLFVITEVGFEKIREKRIEKRNTEKTNKNK